MSKKLKIVLLVIWLSQLADWIYFISINLKVFQLTQVAWGVSLLYLSQYIIGVFFHPLIGRLVDVYNPKNFFIAVNTMRSLFVFILLTTENLLLIYSLIFFIQLAGLFNETITIALSSKVVAKNQIESFNIWRGFATSSAVIIGPAISGLLLFEGNLAMPIIMNGILLVICVLIMSLMRLDFCEIEDGNQVKDNQNIGDSGRISSTDRNLFFALIYMGIGIIAAIDSIEAVFMTETNELSASNYSLLLGVAGLGAIISAFVQIKFSLGKYRVRLIHIASITTAIAYVFCSWQNTFNTIMISFFLLSFTLNYLQTNMLTLIQLRTTSKNIGKEMSRLYFIESIAGMVGIFIIAIASISIEVRLLYRIASFILLVIFLLAVIHGVDKRGRKCNNSKSNCGTAD